MGFRITPRTWSARALDTKRDDVGEEVRGRVKSIMPLVAVATSLALSAFPMAPIANTLDDVSIVTTVTQPAGPGAPVRQSATVTDTGLLPLSGLHVFLGLAPGCEWFLLFLPPGVSTTVTCAGPWSDTDRTVTATVSGHDLLGRRVAAGSTTTLRPPRPAVRLNVVAVPSLAVPGELVRYPLVVTNTGDVPLAALTVAAIGATWCDRRLPGPLAPAATTAVECTAPAGRGDRSAGFRVTGRDTFGDQADATAAAHVGVVVPGMGLELSGPAERAPAGHEVSITVRLTDTASLPLSHVLVTGTPVGCDHEVPWLPARATVTYTCPATIGTRTLVSLAATAVPAIDGAAIPGVEPVRANSTLVLLPAPTRAPGPTTRAPRPTTPAPAPPTHRAKPRPVLPVRPAPASSLPVVPAVPPSAPPTSRASATAPAGTPRARVTERATGPLANPARAALVIGVLAALVMTVSVGALSAATRSRR
jgi:hypothetical protein